MLKTLPGCALCMCILAIGMWLTNSHNDNGQWIAQIGIFFYLAFFSIGMGATPWTVNSEIYPLHLRGIGNSMSTLGNWLGNYLISALFLTATETDTGEVITYFVLGGFCMGAFLFIYLLLPETKGKTIEENIKNIIPDLRTSIMSNFLVLTFYFFIDFFIFRFFLFRSVEQSKDLEKESIDKN